MLNSIAWPNIQVERLSIPRGSSGEPALDVRTDSLESARVQTLRGIACLLLVAFHTIGSTAASGLHVTDASRYREFANLFVHVRMPLFTFLSGLVYAYRPLRAGHALEFSGKKLRRLGLPLIVASTLLYCLHLAMHHGVPPLWQMWTIYVFPYWHLWFVQALLLVFVVLVVLESLGALSTFARFILVFALSLVLYSHGPFEKQNIFGLHNATYLLPFFLLGLGAHRYRDRLRQRQVLVGVVLCFVLTQGFHSYSVLTRAMAPIDPLAHRSALNLLVGLSASLCALQLMPPVRLMEKIGGSSFAIYLYHPLFVAAVLFAAGAQVATSTSLLFVLAGLGGIVGPMLMERGARLIPGGPLLLEGRVASAVSRADEVASISVRVPAGRIRRVQPKPGPGPDDPFGLEGGSELDGDVRMAPAGASS
jgi:surface polysaccharide O-acyltransferase-like enzyme